jgi:uncharacterized protein YjaG (DUF416 family)
LPLTANEIKRFGFKDAVTACATASITVRTDLASSQSRETLVGASYLYVQTIDRKQLPQTLQMISWQGNKLVYS